MTSEYRGLSHLLVVSEYNTHFQEQNWVLSVVLMLISQYSFFPQLPNKKYLSIYVLYILEKILRNQNLVEMWLIYFRSWILFYLNGKYNEISILPEIVPLLMFVQHISEMNEKEQRDNLEYSWNFNCIKLLRNSSPTK